MHMQMARHPRAPSPPLIDPHIQSLRLKRTLRKPNGPINQSPQCRPLSGLIIQKRRPRITERNQQVPIGIRIPIEQNHPILCPLDHTVRRITPRRPPVIK